MKREEPGHCPFCGHRMEVRRWKQDSRGLALSYRGWRYMAGCGRRECPIRPCTEDRSSRARVVREINTRTEPKKENQT
jgi:hypothetical protein